jgi:hypothetical protein
MYLGTHYHRVCFFFFNSLVNLSAVDNGSMRSNNELLRKSLMQGDKKKYSNKYTLRKNKSKCSQINS